MVTRYHLDTDFLILALGRGGSERVRLLGLCDAGQLIEMSSIAWYEFTRGPRTAEQIGIARALFGVDGIVPFSEALAEQAGRQFRALGQPRRRAADIAIGVVAVSREAVLLTCNGRDFAGIEGLRLEEFKA